MTDTKFKKGQTPWNKNLKGIHLSPHSEFKKGQRGINWVPVGTTKVRMFHGQMRTYQKTSEPNTWRLRSQVVWESINGKLPKGHIVHHKDRDVLNDAIDNLQLMTRGEHLLEHRAEYESARLAGVRNMRRVPLNCLDCQTEFHATRKGKYCLTCRKRRIRESRKKYKQRIKIARLAESQKPQAM